MIAAGAPARRSSTPNEVPWMQRTVFRFLLPLLLSLMSAPESARAEDEQAGEAPWMRPYVAYEVGLSVVRNQNLIGADATGADLWGRIEPDPGFAVGGALGARFLDLFRGEVHLSYRQSDVQDMGVGTGPTEASGEIGLFAAMANFYGDLDLDWGVVPYAGFGIGYGLLEVDAESRDTLQIGDEASVFVWNVMAGATVPYGEVTELSLGYRYLATTDPELDSRVTGRGARRLDSEYDAHELVMAVRFSY